MDPVKSTSLIPRNARASRLLSWSFRPFARSRELVPPGLGGNIAYVDVREPRSHGRLIQLAIFVCLPTLIAAIYYGFIASDRYVATAQLVVNSQGSSGSGLLEGVVGTLGSLLGGGGSGVSSQGEIVTAYLTSTELFANLEKDIDVSKMYASPDADFLSRLKPDRPFESRYDYFTKMVDVEWDSQSNVVRMRVQAFKPQDSKTILDEMVKLSEEKLNSLSMRQQRDAIDFAQQQLSHAEDRLGDARKALATFRRDNAQIDPENAAKSDSALVAAMKSKLTEVRTELAKDSSVMKPNSAQILALKAQVSELEKQIAQELAGLAGDAPGTLSEKLSEYEGLQIEEQFALDEYKGAMLFLESARAQALRQNAYVVDSVAPLLPEQAVEPRRLRNIATVFLLCFLLLGIGNIAIVAVREQARL
jgi:capsular polysaccharide transport system permease protein